MEIFTFLGVSGAVFVLIHVLEQSGLSINEDMVRLFMELSKFGGILWILNLVSKLFL